MTFQEQQLKTLVGRRMTETDKAKKDYKETKGGLKNVRVNFTPTQLKRMGL